MFDGTSRVTGCAEDAAHWTSNLVAVETCTTIGCSTFTTDAKSIPCGAGQTWVSNTCQDCELGKYSIDVTATSGCKSCNPGLALISPSQPCSACPKGAYLNGLSCQQCSASKFNDQIGSTSLDACRNCTAAGYYCPKGTTLEKEYPCPIGKHSFVPGIVKESDCQICSAGRFSIKNGLGTECKSCQIGRYIIDKNLHAAEHDSETDCKSCPSIAASSGVGHGFTDRKNECEICPKGRYLQQLLATTDGTAVKYPKCFDCQAGRFLDTEGKTNILFCKSCDVVGKFSNNGSSTCTNCPGGYYSDVANSPSCTYCDRGMYNDDRGDDVAKHNSVDDCNVCEPGKISRLGDTYCFNCPLGWAASTTADKRAECEMCNSGSRSVKNEIGGQICEECTSGQYQSEDGKGFCYPCVPGEFNLKVGQKLCQRCSEGKFGENTNRNIPCLDCPHGFISSSASPSCLKCSAGEYGSIDGIRCKLCEQGYARNGKDLDATHCKICELGQTTAKKGSNGCDYCVIGKFASSAGFCQDCPWGWFSDTKGMQQCTKCKTGEKFIKNTSKCVACDLGKFNSEHGLCSPCQIGRYNDIRNATQCIDCPPDTFSTEEGKTSLAGCSSCYFKHAPNTNTGGKTGIGDPITGCVCAGADPIKKSAGFYTVPEPLEVFKQPIESERELCIPCPEGALCQTGMFLEDLSALPGYWRAKRTSKIFPACSQGYLGLDTEKAIELGNERCCPSENGTSICMYSNKSLSDADRQVCLKGYSGNLCKVCAANYVFVGNDCIYCQGGGIFTMAMIPIFGSSFILFIIVYLFFMCGSAKKSNNLTIKARKTKRKVRIFGQIKILMSYFQVFSSMPSVLSAVPWPDVVLNFTIPLSVFNLDFMGAFSGFGCTISVRFFDRFILHMMLPFFCLVATGAAFVAARICTSKKKAERRKFINETVSKVIILIILLLFPGLSTKIFSVFSCRTVNGIQGSLLVQDFSIVCYEGEHVKYMFIGLAFFILFILGIPLTMLILLWRNKKHLHDETSPRHTIVKTALGGLYTQYEQEYWWFELVLLLNKTLMCGALVIIAPGSSHQILFAIIIMFFHLLAVLKLAPYEKDSEDWSSTICTMTLMLTPLGAFTMMMQDDPEDIRITGVVLITVSYCILFYCILFYCILFYCIQFTQTHTIATYTR